MARKQKAKGVLKGVGVVALTGLTLVQPETAVVTLPIIALLMGVKAPVRK